MHSPSLSSSFNPSLAAEEWEQSYSKHWSSVADVKGNISKAAEDRQYKPVSLNPGLVHTHKPKIFKLKLYSCRLGNRKSSSINYDVIAHVYQFSGISTGSYFGAETTSYKAVKHLHCSVTTKIHFEI